MVAHTVVLFLIEFHRLAARNLESAAYAVAILRFEAIEIAVQSEEVGPEAHGKTILCREIALTERKIMNGIEEIGLSATIFPHNAIHFRAESKLGRFVIFKIDELKIL